MWCSWLLLTHLYTFFTWLPGKLLVLLPPHWFVLRSLLCLSFCSPCLFIIGESLMSQSLKLFSSYTHTFDHLIQSHGCKTIYMPVTLNYVFSSDLVSEPQIYIQLPTYYLHLDVKYTSQLNMFKMKLLIFLLKPFPLVSFSISDSGSSILSVAQVKT